MSIGVKALTAKVYLQLLLLALFAPLAAAEKSATAEPELLDESLANDIDHLDYLFTPGHIFPLFGSHPYVKEGLPAGVKAPLPYGITTGVFSQTQQIQLTDFQINSIDALGLPIGGIPDFFPLVQGLSNVKVHIPNDLVQKSVRADAWLLPMVNVFVMYGEVEGDVSVDVEIPQQDLAAGTPLSDLLGGLLTLPRIDIPLFDVHYYGETVGVGYTVAIGYKRLFASWTEVDTETNLNSDQGFAIQSDSHVMNPRVGWLVSPWLTAWVGALHLEVSRVAVQSQRADFLSELDLLQDLPVVGGVVGDLLGDILTAVPTVNEAVTLDFEVALTEEQPWNYLAGSLITVTPNVTIELEVGWGVRQYWLAGLGLRF